MRTVLLVLFSAFVLGNIVTEWRNRKALPWQSNPLSAYLAGVPGAKAQDFGYLLCAAGLVIFGISLGDFWYILMGCVAAVALYLVVITKIAIANGDTRIDGVQVERAHVISAGVAFISCTAMLLRYGVLAHNQWVFALAIAAPLSALLVMLFEPDESTIEEKSYLAFLLAALGVALFSEG